MAMLLSASTVLAQADLQVGRVFDLWPFQRLQDGGAASPVRFGDMNWMYTKKVSIYRQYGNAIENYLKTDRKNIPARCARLWKTVGLQTVTI